MNEAKRLAYLDSTREKITQYGHVVQAVATEPYPYAYSIGLAHTLGFELITMGLPIATSQHLLNDLARHLSSNPHADDADVQTPEFQMPMRLRTYDIERGQRDKLLNVARALDMKPALVRQVVWPDPAGRFPGDPAYDFHCKQDLDELLLQMM